MIFNFWFQYNFTHTEAPFQKEFEAENIEQATEQAKEFALLKMLDFQPTIKQIWDAVPYGKAIKDTNYLSLCDFVEEKRIPRSIPTLANIIPGLWDMTPKQAKQAIESWFGKNLSIDPTFIEEMKEIDRRNLLEN